MNASTRVFKVKVSLIGEEGVGKTSLVHRFVSGAFDPSYIRTLGIVVSKKTVDLDAAQGRPVRAELIVSDLMGNRTFLQLFRDAYFQGTRGVMAVFDVTRRASLLGLTKWLDNVRESVGSVPIVALGNKVDLAEHNEVSDRDVAKILGPYGCSILFTSAKTGENIEEAFRGLAGAILRSGRLE